MSDLCESSQSPEKEQETQKYEVGFGLRKAQKSDAKCEVTFWPTDSGNTRKVVQLEAELAKRAKVCGSILRLAWNGRV
jgi:hypothetical protein